MTNGQTTRENYASVEMSLVRVRGIWRVEFSRRGVKLSDALSLMRSALTDIEAEEEGEALAAMRDVKGRDRRAA